MFYVEGAEPYSSARAPTQTEGGGNTTTSANATTTIIDRGIIAEAN